MWQLIYTSKNYRYWQKDNYFNCTKDDNPPSENDGGYYNLFSLISAKNDSIAEEDYKNLVRKLGL